MVFISVPGMVKIAVTARTITVVLTGIRPSLSPDCAARAGGAKVGVPVTSLLTLIFMVACGPAMDRTFNHRAGHRK